MHKSILSLMLSCLFLSSTGCRPDRESSDSKVIKTFVSIEPLAFVAKKIGGDLVSVSVLVHSGQSPATYDPTSKQLAELSRSKVFFRTHVPFEKALIKQIKSICKDLIIVDTCRKIKLRKMESHLSPINHGEEEPERKNDLDPHVWMDPLNLEIQARTICRELEQLDQVHADIYRKNLAALLADLDQLHKTITRILAPYKGRSFYVFHPSFGYFADRYGLKQHAIQTEGKEPSARQIIQLAKQAKAETINLIILQREFSSNSAKKFAKIMNTKTVYIDPLSRDYITNLTRLAEILKQSFSKKETGKKKTTPDDK